MNWNAEIRDDPLLYSPTLKLLLILTLYYIKIVQYNNTPKGLGVGKELKQAHRSRFGFYFDGRQTPACKTFSSFLRLDNKIALGKNYSRI